LIINFSYEKFAPLCICNDQGCLNHVTNVRRIIAGIVTQFFETVTLFTGFPG